MDNVNDRLVLDLDLEPEFNEEPAILTIAVISEDVELTEVMECARCVGECKIF